MRILLWFMFVDFHFIGGIVKAVAGPIIGGLFGKSGQESANAQTAASAKEQMDFQERMSNTSYQRGMEDMRKAGLNPMLAFMKGGASVPDGARYEAKNEMSQMASGLSDVNLNQVENINASTALQTAQAKKALAEADLVNAQTAEVQERTPTYAKSIELTDAQISKVKTEVGHILADIDLKGQEFAKVMAEVNNVIKSGKLIDAQTEHSLAQAGLTSAQIAEVVPRINNTIAHTAQLKARFGFDELLGDKAEFLNLPKALNNANIPNDLSKWLSDKLFNFSNSAKKFSLDGLSSPRMRRNNERNR